MPGQCRADVDDRAVGCALRRHTAQRRRTGLPRPGGDRREVSTLPRSGQRGRVVGVAMLATGADWRGG